MKGAPCAETEVYTDAIDWMGLSVLVVHRATPANLCMRAWIQRWCPLPVTQTRGGAHDAARNRQLVFFLQRLSAMGPQQTYNTALCQQGRRVLDTVPRRARCGLQMYGIVRCGVSWHCIISMVALRDFSVRT
jgi:hypothetical protein